MASGLELVPAGLDHPDALQLIDEVQAEYVAMYGGPDRSPMDPAEFAPPHGLLLVGYDAGAAVAMGGWRRLGDEQVDVSLAGPAVEVKRMYVAPAARGRGFARAVLHELERTAADAGARWVLLGTGHVQTAAIALYRSQGYRDVTPFGYYADTTGSVHLGKSLAGD
jgi:ribosomal protein S18 acetylase RimI-like enzyme